MIQNDLLIILQWWGMLFILGLSLLPIATLLFHRFVDKGYFFSKILSLGVLSYLIFILGTFHILPFTRTSIILVLLAMFVVSYGFGFWKKKLFRPKRTFLILIFFEEALFLLVTALWSLIRGFNPEIHGLEKYMDYGFINSILRAEYFPPKDMWFTPFSINYYYFGHFYSAVLTKLSDIPPSLTYNLLVGTVAGLCFTASLALGMSLLSHVKPKIKTAKIVAGGVVAGLLVAFSGNLHTIYTLFRPYENEHPVPFWSLQFLPFNFPNAYWYPNATRYIYNTIHEFPIYSWVVSDLHGHVTDIPFVLLTIAMLFTFLLHRKSKAQELDKQKSESFQISSFGFPHLLLVSFLLAVMYMTNAWDGLIYMLLAGLVLLYIEWQRVQAEKSIRITSNPLLFFFNQAKRFQPSVLFIKKSWLIDLCIGLTSYALLLGAGFVLFSLPFSLHFKPFVSGIGVLCAPDFLVTLGTYGPFLFEADHCQHSPWWQLLILYAFFAFFAISLIIFLRKREKTVSDIFVSILITLSTLLIFIPEFFYIKDIYPAHYRANTMFKLVFQAFIMLSLVSSYTIVRILSNFRLTMKNITPVKILYPLFFIITFILLVMVLLYPYLATMSYYNDLKTYKGMDGTRYLKDLYPSDFAAITWINNYIKGQPVILEAQGDSYTDYARISSNTGLPTVLGWTVHEWLWRGTYDIPAPRITDVQLLYESPDLQKTKELLKKYNVRYVFLGSLEREKYPGLIEEKWNTLGKVIYQNGLTKIFLVSSL